MRFRHHDPDPRLRDLVQGYWELEDLHLAAPVENADLPERTVRLLFSAGTVLMGPDASALRPLPPVTLTRFSLQSQANTMQGQVRALVAELYPWGARQLLGWSAQQAPGTLDTALSTSAWGREVIGLLRQQDWAAAREALEASLLARAAEQDEPGVGVRAARQIYTSLGNVQVTELAGSLAVSPRTLERQFAQQVGVSPKTLARVVRFDEMNSRIRLNPAVSMADLSFELGFFDQSHLINEFKALSSLTPGAFAAFAARHQYHMDSEKLLAGENIYLEGGSLSDFEPGPT